MTAQGTPKLILDLIAWMSREDIEPQSHGTVTGQEYFAADFTPEDAERVVVFLKEHGAEEYEGGD